MSHLAFIALLPTLIIATSVPGLAPRAIVGDTLTCTHYTQANTASATCNDRPDIVCLQKCTGAVVATNCTLGQTSAPSAQQTCTISFGQTSAANSICINQQGSFLCSGPSTGQATCSGCVDSATVNPAITGPASPVPVGTALGAGTTNITSPLAVTPTPTSGAPASPPVSIPSQNFTSGPHGASASPPSSGIVTIYAAAPASTGAPTQSVHSGKSNKSSNSSISADSTGGAADPVNSATTTTASIASWRYTKTFGQVFATLGLVTVGALVI